MKQVGGNVTAQVQLKTTGTKNEIGERVAQWETIHTVKGWLDLSAGDSKYTNYSTKLQESTHIFICGYIALDPRVKAENSRLLIGGKRYDIMLIDNPMGMNKHLEIYLNFTGGQ